MMRGEFFQILLRMENELRVIRDHKSSNNQIFTAMKNIDAEIEKFDILYSDFVADIKMIKAQAFFRMQKRKPYERLWKDEEMWK